MTRNIPELLKEPPVDIGESLVSSNDAVLAPGEPTQGSLSADPESKYRDALHFYQHDMDWANRLILGDRMTMMVSLARREDLAGKLQMIYMDPLAGIRFASKFPSQVGRWGVKYRRRTWHVSRSRYRRTMRQVPTHIWHTCATS